MFDANARYLPAGSQFFAVVRVADQSTELGKKVWPGDVVLCTKLTKERNGGCKVAVHFPCESLLVDGYGSHANWLVYAGRTDFKGFINDDHREKAKATLAEVGDVSAKLVGSETSDPLLVLLERDSEGFRSVKIKAERAPGIQGQVVFSIRDENQLALAQGLFELISEAGARKIFKGLWEEARDAGVLD